MAKWLSVREATVRLTRRYEEQCEKYPHTREALTLERYIACNIEHVRRHHGLESYAQKAALTQADIAARRASIPSARD